MKDSGFEVGAHKVLVISDDDRLARAITLILRNCLSLEIIERGTSSPSQWPGSGRDVKLGLIVLALSSTLSEPIPILSRAALARRIGRVPILIVSERVFSSNAGDKIFHVDLFDPHKLCEKAHEILAEQRAYLDPNSGPMYSLHSWPV